MPRQMRSLSKSKVYHVMVRGNERKNIFLDDDDKKRYIDTLSKITGHLANNFKNDQTRHSTPGENFHIYAYCLMDNHVHLLINEGDDEISRIMKSIGISYAYYFNKKYGRVGHLFQDRFKSEVIEDDNNLLTVIRYIHNNPVKAGIVYNASQYPWSSFSEYVKENSRTGLIITDTVLGILANNKAKAIRLFLEYSKQEDESEFLDCTETIDDKTIKSIREADNYVRDFLSKKSIEYERLNDKENIKIRNELILKLRKYSNLSIREMAELLKIGRGVIQGLKS